jgi:hypothetical protein
MSEIVSTVFTAVVSGRDGSHALPDRQLEIKVSPDGVRFTVRHTGDGGGQLAIDVPLGEAADVASFLSGKVRP